MARDLSAEEEALAALLARGGLRPAEARCLALLLRGASVTRQEAARATGLSPQDVSAAMRRLEESGAARVEPAPKGAPGRPQLRYQVAGAAREVLLRLVEARRAEVARELEALDALGARAETLQA